MQGEGVLLNMALIQFALAHAVQQGCQPITTLILSPYHC